MPKKRGCSTQFAQQLESAVTAPPLIGCVVWSLEVKFIKHINSWVYFWGKQGGDIGMFVSTVNIR